MAFIRIEQASGYLYPSIGKKDEIFFLISAALRKIRLKRWLKA